MADPIKVEGVSLPGDNMDPTVIDAAAKNIRSVGSKVSTRGGTLQTAWQGLATSYHAPEQEKLFSAMTPATNQAAFFGTDMGSAASALETFATEVRTIKAEVAKIKSEAITFLGQFHNGQQTVPITGPETRYATSSTKDVAWNKDQGNVDANNALIHRMNTQQENLWTAERACANSLNAISGAASVGAVDPKTGKGGYGYTDLPDNAEMPWGHSVSRQEGCGERMVKGFFVDGLFNGLLQGVTSLAGFSWTGPEGVGFHWSTLGHTWTGVAKLATALSPATIPMMFAPGPAGDWARSSEKALAQTVTGFVGIDPFAKDPFAAWHKDSARTFGSSLFNIASFAVPETKAGDVGKAGEVGDAGRVAEGTSKAGRVINLATDGAKFMKGITLDGLSKITSKIGDFGKTFKFGDEMPKVDRGVTGTGHTNLGSHDHADAPPARTDPGTHTEPGTQDHAGAQSDHAGQHDGTGQHDGAVHHGSSGEVLKGDPAPHAIADDAKGFADDVTARAEKSTEHTQALHERDSLAHQMGVDPKNLTVQKFPETLRQLRDSADTPAEARHVRDLQQAVLQERTTARDLNHASENLGTTAARDYLKSHGDDVIVGDHSLPGRPGTLDNIGLSHDHSTLTVVEAKGGDGSRLGSRTVDGVKVQQGSTTYLNDLLHRDPDLKQYLHEHPDLARSIADGRTEIKYEMVKAHNNGRIQVTPFKLNLSDLHLGDLLDSTAVGGRK